MSNLGEVSQKYSTCLKTKSQCKKDCKKWSRKNAIINAHSKYGKDTIININPHNIRYTHIYTSTSQYISLNMVLKPQEMWCSQHEKRNTFYQQNGYPFFRKVAGAYLISQCMTFSIWTIWGDCDFEKQYYHLLASIFSNLFHQLQLGLFW